ncbi:MAG: hypothetical protein VZR53_13105 [Prevotella sp.]|nr:hypothetical protein [Prevotella sp.]
MKEGKKKEKRRKKEDKRIKNLGFKELTKGGMTLTMAKAIRCDMPIFLNDTEGHIFKKV